MTEDDDAAREVPEEYESILHALRGMEHSLDTIAKASDPDWRDEARHELRDVVTSIARHCFFAESPDGLVSRAERTAGHTRRITAAHQEHERLSDQARELIVALLQDADLDALRGRADELIDTLRKHLALEVDLVYDAAFAADTGVGD